jgi:nucleoside-diphosphate-sugar epimerase
VPFGKTEVDDVNAALKGAMNDSPKLLFDVFNVASDDTLTVREISEIVIQQMFVGKEKPKATGSGEEAWAENRRADIVY